jgi:hypothetical protein
VHPHLPALVQHDVLKMQMAQAMGMQPPPDDEDPEEEEEEEEEEELEELAGVHVFAEHVPLCAVQS